MREKTVILYLRQSAGGGGGADTVIQNIAGLLDPNFFSAAIAYLRKPEDDISPIINILKDKGISYSEIPGKSFLDLGQFKKITGLIKSHRIEIVHCNDPKSDVYGCLLKILFPAVKFLSTAHGWIHRRARSALYIKMDMLALKRFDAVIAVSKDTKHTAEKQGIRRVHVIHNGIDINRWQPRKETSSGAFKVGYVGRISREKGPLDFIRTADTILRKDSAFEFVVAGDGPLAGEMKNLAESFGISDKITFKGQVGAGEMPALYNSFDILLSPSHTEGLPNNILEAMAMSVPVVATNVGGVGEIITHNHNGLLSDAGDVSSLAEHVLTLKRSPETAGKFGRNGRAVIESDFSVYQQVKKIENLYCQLLNNKQ